LVGADKNMSVVNFRFVHAAKLFEKYLDQSFEFGVYNRGFVF
jgi:hypothetical protein